MDGSNWKKLLLQWINSSGLLERSFYNIEQTDIYEFYSKLRQKMISFPYTQEDLSIFLKEHYPNVEFHTDDEDQLSSSDYMYVYSLLLHFCCVKYSDEYFQKICQNLHNTYQESIAIFFKELLVVEILDKTILRNVISMAIPSNIPKPIESPLRSSNPKVSPPTPKTFMLDERTKEMQKLKALLASETYERSYLEMLLKQNEETTSNLVKGQKKFVTEIKELKTELLAKSTENTSSTKNISDEQIKKQLRKQITDKEEELLNLKQNFNLLTEDKKLLQQKVKHAESQMSTCMENIVEYDSKINDLKIELEQKEIYIKQLTDSKNELIQYINELRNSSCRGTELNTSVECLDNSLSRTPNSSGSLGCPENLGCSVIDIQLREKENENNQLRAEIEKFKSDNKKLYEYLSTLLKKLSFENYHVDNFDICNENIITNKDDDLTEFFVIFENYLENLIQQYSTVNKNFNQSTEENNNLKNQISDLGKKIFMLGNQITDYDQKVDDLKKVKLNIEEENQTYKATCESYNIKIEELLGENTEMRTQLNNLNENYNKSINEKYQLNKDVLEVTENVKEKCKKIEEFENLNKKLQTANKSLQQNIKELNNNNKNLENLTNILKQEKDVINDDFLKFQSTFTQIKETKEKLENENRILLKTHEEHLQIIDKCKSTLINLENNIRSKETDIQKCGDNLLQRNNENTKLNLEIKSLKHENAELIKHKQEMEDKYMLLQNKFELKIQEITKTEREIDEKTVKTDKLYSEIEMLTSKDLASKNTLEKFKIQVVSLKNEISENKKEIAKLNEQLNIANESFAHLKTENDKELLEMKNKLEKYLENEKLLKQKNDELNDQNGELKDNLKLSIRSSKDKSQEIDSLENKLNNKIIECSNLSTEIEKLTSNKSKIESDIENLKFALFHNDRKTTELNTKLEEITSVKEKLCEDYTSLKKYNLECKNQTKCCEIEIEKLNNTIAKLETEKNKLSNDYDEISNVVETFTNEKLSVQVELVNLQNALAEKSDCFIKTTNFFDEELNNIIKEIENNIDNLVQNNGITNILQVNLEFNNPLQRLKNTINILLNGNSEMLQKKAEFEKIISNLKNDLNVQAKEKNELSEKILITTNDNEALNTKLLKLTEQVNEMVTSIRKVTDSCNVFKQEQFNLLDKLSTQQNELEHIKSEKNSLIHEKSNINNKYDELLQEYEVKKNDFYAKCTEFDNTLQDKNTKISMCEDEKLKFTSCIKELTEKIKISNEKLKQYEEEKIESENIHTTMKYNNNLALEKYVSKEKECMLLSEEMRALTANRFSLEENLLKSKKTLEEYEKFKEKYEDLKESRKTLKTNNEQLLKELNIIKILLEEEKSNFRKEIRKITKEVETSKQQSKSYLHEIDLLKKNVTNLSDNLNEIQDENIIYKEENRNLKEKLELELIKTDVNQKKIKELQNHISCLEIKIQTSDEDIEALKNQKDLEYLMLEKKYSNLNTEFNKLNECHLKAEESSLQLNKRLEIISIRLGEYQAKNSNFETENNSLKMYFESNKNTLDSLQKEYSKLILKHSNLQKEYSRIEKEEESIKLKLNEMEQNNQMLKIELDKTLAAELNGRDNLQKLQLLKKDDDEKIKKISTTLAELTSINQSIKQEMEYLEQKNVNLTLEIGSLNQLNQTIEDIKKAAQTENIDITKNMIEIKNNNESLRDVIDQQQTELNQLQEENSKLNDNISKLSLNIQIITEERENFYSEVNNLKSTVKQLQNEKENSLRESFVSLALLKNLESQQTTKDEKIEKLKEVLDEKDKCIQQLNNEIDLRKLQTNNKDDLKKKIKQLEELNILYEQQKEKTEKLKRDTSIFQAKLTKQRAVTEEKEKEWLEEKNRLIELNKTSEERIKNNRLELEGKLEKMKAKMKTLYNEEVNKMKNKHEREIFDFQAEIQVLKGQNDKYDMHVKKLSQRVVTLNEKICEYERDNRFMELKLKEYDSIKTASLRRPQHQESHMHPPQFPMNSQKILSTANLRMEDEEGELFNNTYLTDLKEGRISDFGIRDSISVKELQYRNSLAAPHLRSTYLAQYKEHNLPEEDIKDGIGPINLDDSLSSLLNTDKRKKVAGTTSYKRPGPPTPSKTAGRLSFGGHNEVHSTILKESNENDVSTTRKTPAKFKLFSSRAPKDENTPPKRRLSNLFKKK